MGREAGWNMKECFRKQALEMWYGNQLNDFLPFCFNTLIIQGVSRLVSKVTHPFSRTYVDAAGCPFAWWSGIEPDLVFEKKIWNVLFCQVQGHVQARPGFQAQPRKGQPTVSMYVWEKGCLTFYTHRETPCTSVDEENWGTFIVKITSKAVGSISKKAGVSHKIYQFLWTLYSVGA